VLNVVKLLNFFPTKGRVSETLSRKTIVLGETLYYKKHLSLQIGQYCQAHEEDNIHNSQQARTKGSISLGPSVNMQGGFKFMDLNTGKNIVCLSWDVIPMPDVVIARVNALGSDQPRQMTFTDRHGRLIRDIEIPGVDSDKEQEEHFPGVAPVIDTDIEIPGVDVAGPEALEKAPAPQAEINDVNIPQDEPISNWGSTTPRSISSSNANTGRNTGACTRASQINSSKDTGETGIHSEHDRLKVFLCSNSTVDPGSAQSRCAYVCARGFLSSRARHCGIHYDTTLTQGRSEGMG
jgi:hypothetical protein